jgi:hypothetical protein
MTRRLDGRAQAVDLAVSPPAFNGLARGGAIRPGEGRNQSRATIGLAVNGRRAHSAVRPQPRFALSRPAVNAMLGNLRTRRQAARGARLKRQFENATLWINDLWEEQAERFGRGLNFLFNDWVERFGPVKDCDAQTRKFTVKEMRSDARRRYEHDIGASYALEFLSYHIEASYLPGEDAATVYDLTSQRISEWGHARAGDARRDEDGTG